MLMKETPKPLTSLVARLQEDTEISQWELRQRLAFYIIFSHVGINILQFSRIFSKWSNFSTWPFQQVIVPIYSAECDQWSIRNVLCVYKTRQFFIFSASLLCFFHNRLLFWGLIVPAGMCKKTCSGCVLTLGTKRISPQRDCMCNFLIIFSPSFSSENCHCLAVLPCLEPRWNWTLCQLSTTKADKQQGSEHFPGTVFQGIIPSEGPGMPVHPVFADLCLGTVARTDSSLKWINFHGFFISLVQDRLNEQCCERSNT